MPIQILPQLTQPRQQSWGEILGTGLGQGISQFAQQKLGEMSANKQRQQQAKAWESIGLPANVSNFLVNQPEFIQRDFLARLEGLDLMGQQPHIPSGQVGQPSTAEQVIESQLQARQEPSIRIGKSAEQKKEAAGLRKEQAEKFKATKEYREKILQSKKNARETLKDLSRLEELSESGKLSTPGYVEFLNRSGLNIPSLMTPESEEFQKIQANFLRNAKQYYGGRVSNYEVEQFLKTVPALSQSPEGRSRVLSNLKRLARGEEEYYKAYEEVLHENKGVPPYDVEEQVERKVEKRLDAISNQFKKDLIKPVPKGQSKLITALQAGVGSAIKPAGLALTGAAAGSVIPGIGTLAGGIAGGAAGLGAKLSGLL